MAELMDSGGLGESLLRLAPHLITYPPLVTGHVSLVTYHGSLTTVPGEGLLPLAYDAITSGLVAPSAQLLPSRLRVWAFLAELRGSGTALDGAELVPSLLHG